MATAFLARITTPLRHSTTMAPQGLSLQNYKKTPREKILSGFEFWQCLIALPSVGRCAHESRLAALASARRSAGIGQLLLHGQVFDSPPNAGITLRGLVILRDQARCPSLVAICLRIAGDLRSAGNDGGGWCAFHLGGGRGRILVRIILNGYCHRPIDHSVQDLAWEWNFAVRVGFFVPHERAPHSFVAR